MRHPRRANSKPHDHPRKLIAARKKAKRQIARGLVNVIESIR